MRGQRQTLLDRLPLLIGSTQQLSGASTTCRYNRLVDRYEKYDQQWSLEAMRRFGMWL